MKKNNVFKVLSIVILLTMILSYFIPGTTMSYGSVTKGTISPIPFVDLFTNGITSLSAFLTIFIYVLFIGVFYAVLKKTGKYEALVNNTAVCFNKNKSAFVVLVMFILGLITMFTGEIYAMLVFVPFLISVIRKLGYDKKASIVSTVGAILLGNAGSLYTVYANQMLSLTINDNVLTKVVIVLVSIVTLAAFVLLFGNKPEKTKDLVKSNEKKMLPIYITFVLVFILLVLGFVNWSSYFNFNGFNEFLETLRKGQIANVSVFNALVGQNAVAFGNFQPYHAAILFAVISFVYVLIYKIKINDIFDTVEEGFKNAFPYAVIVVLSEIVLVNAYTSGIFFTLVSSITKKTVSLFSSSLTSAIAAILLPDYTYGTQFTFSALTGTTATNYQALAQIVFQAVYNMFLLISPTSILLLFGLKYTEVTYKEWIKYIYKYFIVLFVTVLVIIEVLINGVNAVSISALILLVVALVLIFYLRFGSKKNVKKEVVKEEVKAPVKKTVAKKTTTKKTTTKKTATKKVNKK